MEIHFKSAHTKDVEDEVTPEVVSIAQRKLISLKKYLESPIRRRRYMWSSERRQSRIIRETCGVRR